MLKEELQRELHQTTRLRSLNLPDARAIHVIHRHSKIRVVENIEKLRAKLQIFCFRKPEILQSRNIPLLHARTGDNVAPRISELPDLRCRIQPLKCSRIEPAIRRARVHTVASARSARWISNQIRPVAWEAGNFRRSTLRRNARR